METTEKLKPIKRNQNLVPLSREHHFGLLFCWKLKQGALKKVSPGLLRKFVADYWETQLYTHFELEDDVLEGFVEKDDLLLVSMEEEHRLLEKSIGDIISEKNKTYAEFLNLAELLTQHIRFEERQLFPSLEQKLTEKQLKEIGERLKGKENPVEMFFLPAFWKRDYQPEGLPTVSGEL